MRPRRERWETEFAPVTLELALPDCPPIAWKDVEAALRATVESIRIREINGSSADVLDYEQNRENGLSVIAIGGDKLARGLTLEGLSISYFLRGTTMNDRSEEHTSELQSLLRISYAVFSLKKK